VKTEQVMKRSRAHITYKLADGVPVPGVTTILSVLNKPALVKWANNLGLQGIDSSKYVDEKAAGSPEPSNEPLTIDMAWLKESLEEINWTDVSKWIKEHYPEAMGTTVKSIVQSLIRGHQEAFVAEVQARLEAYRSEQ